MEDDDRASTVLFVAIVSAGVAVLCTILNIAVILKMRNWTLNVKLVYVLCWSQLLYDITFYGGVEKASFHHLKGTSPLFSICTFFQVWMGTSSGLITNVMTTLIYYILNTRKNVDKIFEGEMFHLIWLLFLPGLIMACVAIAPSIRVDEDSARPSVKTDAMIAYTIFRIVSILYNFIVFVLTVHMVNRIVGGKPRKSRNNYENALSLIVDRSKYFWVVQLVCRVAPTVWELKYGYNGYNGHGSNARFASAIAFAFFTPSASLGYLLIFLLCQPSARSSMREILLVDIPYLGEYSLDFLLCLYVLLLLL